jgi:DNA-binding CsgD family transcriptional regulator/PAS domain-containing protein
MALKEEKLYSEILELLLAATLESQMWSGVLEKIAFLAGHQYAALLFYDKGNAQLLTDALLCEEKVFTAYRDVFLALDPAEKILTQAPVGQLYQDREVLGDKFIASSVYYNEFHRPNDMNYLTSVKLSAVNGYACFLSLMTANGVLYPQQSHFDLFKRLIPALIAASHLHARFESLRENLKYQNALLDNHIYPVWLVNDAGRVLYANRHAEHYQDRYRDSWATRHDALHINTDSKKLKQAIRRATVTDSQPKAGLCYTTDSKMIPVLVLPSAQLVGVASIIIPVPMLSGTPLIDIFGLTPSENALVGLLIHGMTAEECALHLRVSIATVRTHLSALFRKTNTRNQSELLLIARAVYG